MRNNQWWSVRHYLGTSLGQAPDSIQEVGEIRAFLKIIGMSHHWSFDILNKLFEVTLPNMFNSPEALMKLEKARKMQKIAPIIFAVPFVFGLFLFGNGQKNGSLLVKIIAITLDVVGLSSAIWLTNKSKSSEMKSFEEEYRTVLREFSILNLKKDEFRFNVIEKDINESNNAALGN